MVGYFPKFNNIYINLKITYRINRSYTKEYTPEETLKTFLQYKRILIQKSRCLLMKQNAQFLQTTSWH